MEKVNVFNFMTALFVVLSNFCVHANPTIPTVVSGNASFIRPDERTLRIHSNSERCIVNWAEFSVGVNQKVYFDLPSASSVVLNRVSSKSFSNILGSIESNGKVLLINENGILLGPTAKVQSAAWIASTLQTHNEDFLNGVDPIFVAPIGSNSSVINYGNIHVVDGDAILIGCQVINAGHIYAPKGTIVECAGFEMTYQPNSLDSSIWLVSHPERTKQPIGIENGGHLEALRVEAQADGLAFDVGIKHDGNIQTEGLPGIGSSVLFCAVEGLTFVNGTIKALDHGEIGGRIAILGLEVELGDNTLIFASGKFGGGSVNIGGGWGGQDPSFLNAKKTTFHSNASVLCDAELSGDAGSVVVWASNTTHFMGTVQARGGLERGDGGCVGISAGKFLNFLGRVDVRAFNGADGSLILDYENLHCSGSLENYLIDFDKLKSEFLQLSIIQ